MNAVKLSSEDGKVWTWACGACGTIMGIDGAYAEQHCRCSRCGGRKERLGYIYCADCGVEAGREREAALWERYDARTALTSWDGPVFDEHSDRYHSDIDACLEELRDDGLSDEELRARRITPCDEVKLATPDLVDVVNQSWAEDGPEDCEEMDRDTAAILNAVHEIVAERAPNVWVPRSERIDVAAYLDA